MMRGVDNPTTRGPRITPRNSEQANTGTDTTAETPWRILNQLANVPRTPLRRASSAGPSSTRLSQRRTPAARTPAALQKGSAKRPVAVTPHGRAAQRELDLRRTGLTPGKDRRKSFLQQRETPRDALRALSRILAPKTLPIEYTPEVSKPQTARKSYLQDGWDDEEALERPRLSLPMGEDEDEDDSLLLPPKSAGLEDESFTAHSIEFGRRAHSEKPLSRLSRGSYGTAYMSDDGDHSRFGHYSDALDDSILPEARGNEPFLGDDESLQEDATGLIRGVDLNRARASLASGRGSDIRPLNTVDEDDTATFVFNVPPRASSPSSRFPRPQDIVESLQLEDTALDEDSNLPTIEDDIDLDIDEAESSENERDDRDDVESEEGGDTVDKVAALESDDIRRQMVDSDVRMAEGHELEDSALVQRLKTARKKKLKLSKHGIQYPSLPRGVVKKLATSFARTAGTSKAKLSEEALDSIIQASDWFFEQASEDLGAYAGHAGRKTIDESDVVTLMTRQRQTNTTTTPFSLAQKYLPRELLQDLRMVPPSKFEAGRQLQALEEEIED